MSKTKELVIGNSIQPHPIIIQQISYPIRLTSGFPTAIVCPNCHQNVTTLVEHNIGAGSYLIAAALCFICPCIACLPCCVDSMQDAVHKCPSCHAVVGVRRFEYCLQ